MNYVTKMSNQSTPEKLNMSRSNLQQFSNLKSLNWMWTKYLIFVSIFRYDSRSICVNLITRVEAGSLVMLTAAIIWWIFWKKKKKKIKKADFLITFQN